MRRKRLGPGPPRRGAPAVPEGHYPYHTVRAIPCGRARIGGCRMHRAAPPSASHAFSETCFLPVSSKTCTRASQCGRKNAICDARVHVFGSGRCRFSRCRFAQRRFRTMPLWLAPVRPAPAQGDAGSVQGQFGPMLDRTSAGSGQRRFGQCWLRAMPVLAGRASCRAPPIHRGFSVGCARRVYRPCAKGIELSSLSMSIGGGSGARRVSRGANYLL